MSTLSLSKFLRGSEWRRWDLHVHTPASALNNQFGDDWDKYVHRLFSEAIRNDIAAIGITDYFLVEGYKRVRREYLDRPERLRELFAKELAADTDYINKIQNILVVPNIEFRLQTLFEKGNQTRRLTVHVIFSDEVAIEEIEDVFLGSIKIDFRGIPNAPNEKLPLSRSNLEKLGERLKREQVEFRGDSAFVTGCKTATVDDDEISRVLAGNPSLFQNKSILVLAEEGITKLSWAGAPHQVRKVLYQKCDALFSSSEDTKNWLTSTAFAEEFGREKPCFWGSDAHRLEDLFRSPGGKTCWIKADPTFGGLLQVLHEPATRCFIGNSPPAWDDLRLHRNPYIKSIHFSKTHESKLKDHWFDGSRLEFNPAMVTIIGNKGAGKSALADTLALVGAAQVGSNNFGFLRSDRFKKKDGSTSITPAGEFTVAVVWSRGDGAQYCLGQEVAPDAVERVRYLPQGYLEKICNERDEDTQSAFRTELDRVIFSHVSQSERLGKTSLSELIDTKTDEIIRSISNKKRHIRDLNHKIYVLEGKIAPAAIRALEDKIASKENELRQLEENPPKDVPPPFDSAADSNAAIQLQQLELYKQEMDKVQADIKFSLQQLTQRRIELQKAEKIRDRLHKFSEYYNSVQPDIDRGLQELGIPLTGVLSASVNMLPVDRFIEQTSSDIASLDKQLDVEEAGNLYAQQNALEKAIQSIHAKLNEPNQRYQQYLAELDAWKRRRAEVVGAQDMPETLEFYKHNLTQTKTKHPQTLSDLKNERIKALREIYGYIEAQAAVYRHYYAPAMKAIGREREILDRFGISFNVVIDGSRFAGDFFAMLNQGVAGTFYGSTAGRQRLRDMCPEGTFDTADSTIRFIVDVMGALALDLRDSPPRRNNLEKQLRKGSSVENLYDFLFTLDYLEPRYVLTVGGKSLQELSPGERGLLLLVFYLMIDKDNIPLIIDQPEENLDNQSIKTVLVPCIKAAKERRQLFVVTHNPNVAVVCDSEQVIFASIDKSDGSRVRYDSGAIESGIINRHLVDVLEGTPPAFENRTVKYRAAGSLR